MVVKVPEVCSIKCDRLMVIAGLIPDGEKAKDHKQKNEIGRDGTTISRDLCNILHLL